MSKPVNKTLVGAFVAGSIALLCAAVVFFGSGKFFKESYEFVLFFDKSLSGLKVGSPVVFRGVPVGRVIRIALSGNMDKMEFRTPVFIELEGSDIPVIPEDINIPYAEYFDKLLANGLRARLSPQSLLTGQLMVELDFYPAYEAGQLISKASYYDGYPEIPTIPTLIDNVMHRLSAMPIDEIADNILEITAATRDILRGANADALFRHMDELAEEVKKTTAHFSSLVEYFRSLSTSYTTLANNTDAHLGQSFRLLDTVLNDVSTTVRNIDQTVAATRGVIGPNTLPVLEFTRAMREFSETARSVRALANMLDRNPEALLRGKGGK